MSPRSSQQFCLILEPESDVRPKVAVVDAESVGSQQARFIRLSNDRVVSLCADRRGLRLARSARSRTRSAARFETARYEQKPVLLLMSLQECPVRVNGLPAGPVNVLRSGDVVEVDRHSLHVALWSYPYVGPAASAQIGVPCGYCRVAIVAKMRVYVCPQCQQVLHFQDETVPRDVRLECAKLASVCPDCQSPIMFTGGLDHVPEV